MSTPVTIAAGPSWHLYLDQYYGRVWLEVEDIHEHAELEVERSVDGGHLVTVGVMLPEDLAEILRRAL